MAKTKSKGAGAQKVSGGPKGGMKGFTAVAAQKPGVTATTSKGKGKK